MLSKIPTAGALEKKLFKFSSETFGSLEKVLTFAAAIARKRKFFERFTYQQVVQETYSIIRNIPSITTINNEILSKGIKKQFNNEEFDPGSG